MPSPSRPFGLDSAEPGIPDRFRERPTAGRKQLTDALRRAIDRIDENLDEFHDRFPGATSEDLVYPPTDNVDGWTTGFWTGLCWLAYEVTDGDRFRTAAKAQLETFEQRLDSGNVETHDLGFLYVLSAVAGHHLTGNNHYRSLAVTAANLLADRFLESPGLIQAWGPIDDANDSWESGRMIVDTMMNLPLLFWASQETDDPQYAAIGEMHALTNAEHVVRPNASTFHTVKFDVERGVPTGGETNQGYDDDSCWARGQAWAMYGYAITADYTDERRYAELSAALTNYYLAHVSEDNVPRWDFDAPADQNVRDSSAAAIAACALDELSRQLPPGDERIPSYRNASVATLENLAETFTTSGLESNGLLTDGAYDVPDGRYDECTIWGDYFYVEGLVRATEQWSRYW